MSDFGYQWPNLDTSVRFQSQMSDFERQYLLQTPETASRHCCPNLDTSVQQKHQSPISDAVVQFQTPLSYFSIQCPNLNRSVQYLTLVFELRHQCPFLDTCVLIYFLVSVFKKQRPTLVSTFRHKCLFLDTNNGFLTSASDFRNQCPNLDASVRFQTQVSAFGLGFLQRCSILVWVTVETTLQVLKPFLSDNVNDQSFYDDSALLAVSSVVMTRGTINHTTINDAFWHFGDKKNGTNLHFWSIYFSYRLILSVNLKLEKVYLHSE